MAFLERLENTDLGMWIRLSSSIWAYPSILTLHTIGLGLLVGTSVIVAMRVLGVAPIIPIEPLENFLRLMWLGFWLNALSGTALFIAGATRHATNPAFYVKMACIALGLVTLHLLRREIYPQSRGATPSPIAMRGKVLAGTSILLWTAAITAGRLMAYVGKP